MSVNIYYNLNLSKIKCIFTIYLATGMEVTLKNIIFCLKN